MAASRNWTWEETLVAFRLYCRTPFGKLHQHNPDIIVLAQKLGRTPSAVGMKACNFASLDPAQQARGIQGLSNTSQLEEQVWQRFHADSQAVAAEAEAAYEALESQPPLPPGEGRGEGASGNVREPVLPPGPTDEERTLQVRRVQGFFRSAVLTSYDNRCALTGLAVPALLNASHIIPWSVLPNRRADPTNGLCLNALHDRAFDRGLITFDDDLRLIVSPRLATSHALGDLTPVLIDTAGQTLHLPERFTPDSEAMAYHRANIYQEA